VRHILCRTLAALLLWAGLASSPALAQGTYPNRPIRFVVPFPAGGSNDIYARIVAERLAESMGQPVVVDNRPGAATLLGSQAVAKSLPDGYTLLIISPSFTGSAALRRKLPFDPIRDFAPITMMGAGSLALVTHPSVPAKTPQEFVAHTQARPGQLNFASAGTGGIGHLAMELLMLMTRTSMTHVPYKSNPAAFTDMVSGRVQTMLPSLMSALPHVKAGRLRVIAVSTAARSPFAPELPTLAESGVPGFAVDVWWGILTTGGTPKPIVDRLNAEITRILNTVQMKDSLAVEGAVPLPGSPGQLGALIRDEIAKWADVVRRARIEVEG
jgi:tripartite-type tricarboxylate transporter receptor subunit TctC